ncbi:hypothetical protein BC332_27044 [Capsicum chinense]|nr:hypothetical protein BC332_27044 [Capsicum chinense]
MLVVMVEVVGGGDRIMGDEGLLLEIFNKFVNELKEKERKRQEDKFDSCTVSIHRYDEEQLLIFSNKTPSPPLKSKEVSSWRSVSLSSGSFYDSGSGKKNFTDLSKSPHGHNKKVHPKKSGRDSSRVPVLIQTIRRLTKEKVQMASEVSSMLRNQVAERASTKEKAIILQPELDSRTRRLETEKNELQSVLEKELDRRSSDWSLKLKKYQIEQHRLRERERELAEQNVSLQREVSSFNEKEVDNRIKMSFSEKPLEDLSKRMEQVSEENQNLRQQFTQLQAEYRIDIKQLQADLAATVRGNDILKCEVQNALDALSYSTPKLKYLELQPSNMGLRQIIDGRIIKKKPIYGGNSPFAFGPHGSYLESHSAMGDASVSSFSSAGSNTQSLNEPLLDADTTSFGFLGEMPQNFGFLELFFFGINIDESS